MEEIKECPKGMVQISVLVAECERIKQNDRSTCSEAFLSADGFVLRGKVMRCENPKLPASAKVLWAVCELSNNIYGIDIIETKRIMRCTGLTKYKVINKLHFWRDKGLIERASMGCPAQVSHGEIEGLISEAAPPINGWRLTEKGYKSNVFKVAEDDYLKSLAELANG